MNMMMNLVPLFYHVTKNCTASAFTKPLQRKQTKEKEPYLMGRQMTYGLLTYK